MKQEIKKRTSEEIFNTLTHLAGVVLTLSLAWIILDLGYNSGWQHAFGVTFFTCGMIVMFVFSTIYHWWMPGKYKRWLRIFDHIGIYVMIAASYTPICIGVVGGALGWVVFGFLWLVVILGTVYKLKALGKYPKLSLFIYLLMGWSGVIIAKPVCTSLPAASLWLILAEGLFYTSGTYFYANDKRPFYHGIWHIFVLLGAACHWSAVLVMLKL
ncbi:hemolysin III family protein [Bacteroides caecimuris]|jgi:hemolysin III|uniref:PAQR family membrane homeostasis protein TrhA n=1 Tax=Bacteroides caecimuris TaxID=1796613 RepID=UPI0026F2FD25|nr:hemolysin III family protein [Bacteroides caecimuris]